LNEAWEAKYRRDANDDFNRRVEEGKAEYEEMQRILAESTATIARLVSEGEKMTKAKDL